MDSSEDNDALWIPAGGTGQELGALAVQCNHEVNATCASLQSSCLKVASALSGKPVALQR